MWGLYAPHAASRAQWLVVAITVWCFRYLSVPALLMIWLPPTWRETALGGSSTVSYSQSLRDSV